MFLKAAKRLRHLNLSKNEIGVKGALVLSQALVINLNQQSGGLIELNLSHNQIGAKGTQLIIESLKDSKMKYLDLSFNHIKDSGAICIA